MTITEHIELHPHKRVTDAVKAGTTIGIAFHPLPCSKYFSHNGTVEESIAGFIEMVARHINSESTLTIESHDHEAVALWILPGCSAPQSNGPVNERLLELKNQSLAFQKKYVKSAKGFYYLNILARNPHSKTRGSVGNVVKPILKRAKDEGVPVVLEAASENSKAVYEHWGFKTYGIIKLGKGIVDEKGEEDPEGDGVTLWFMIYNNSDDK